MKAKNKKTFLYGLGQRLEYKSLFNFFYIPEIDWNKNTIKPSIGKVDTLIGFSMGAILACEHSIKHKLKTLILCSMTTGVETLKDIKAERVIFVVGEKETWVLKDTQRVAETLQCSYEIITIPKGDHRITGPYKKKLIEIIEEIS